VSGAGSGGSSPTNPSSLTTSGSFTVLSTGTANVSIRAINTAITVYATWTQANAQSYRVLYSVSGVGGTQIKDGNSSDTNPLALIGTSANTFTLQSVTVYPELNQGGSGVTLSSTASGTGATRTTDTSGSGSVTYTAPATPPTGGSVSVNPTTGTAGTTTFTASTSGWSGTAPITFTYSWQYLNSSFSYVSVASGTTFAPSTAQNSVALSWRVVVTATNTAGSATASASFTVNNPASAPATPTGLSATTTRTDGINLTWNASSGATSYELWFGPVPSDSSSPDFFPGNSTSYLDTSVPSGTNRTYYVRARSSAGASSWSGGVTGTRANVAVATPAITSGPSISWASGNNFTLSASASDATNIEFQVEFANTNGGPALNTQTFFMGASAGSTTTGAQQYSWARTRARANNTTTGLSSAFTAYTGWA
jgi:hypothetical protein